MEVCERIALLKRKPHATNQATLGNALRRETFRRYKEFLSSPTYTSGRIRSGPPMGTSLDLYPKGLQKHEECWVTKLTDIAILPSVRETGLVGTLEAHINGFIYSAPGFYQVFMHDDVRYYFYRLGIKPLLQFHLRHPIMVGGKETKDIQFCLMPPSDEEDSDNSIRKTRCSSSRNNDLQDFVHKVPETQLACEFRMPYILVDFEGLDEFNFYGDCPIGIQTATFSLTNSALVMLEEQPYHVIPLSDIKIVNLALILPGRIEMTVVFRDLVRDVLEIGSIPLMHLSGIKDWLNYANVKYYVNRHSPNWRELVREVRERPDKFLARGGWDMFEDSHTLAWYSRVEPDSLLDYENVCYL